MQLILMLLFVATTVLSATGHAADAPQGYRLFFPNLNLDKEDGERIEEVHIKVACGHIEAITKIPYDWNVKIIRAISAVEEFHASAGHGASRLTDIDKLKGVIRITVGEKGCFDVSATIMTLGTDLGRQIDLPRSKIKLRH
jgi:hypothetical protein